MGCGASSAAAEAGAVAEAAAAASPLPLGHLTPSGVRRRPRAFSARHNRRFLNAPTLRPAHAGRAWLDATSAQLLVRWGGVSPPEDEVPVAAAPPDGPLFQQKIPKTDQPQPSPSDQLAQAAAPPPSNAAQLARTAVSLAFLREFYSACVVPLEHGAGRELTVKESVELVVMPAAAARRCSWAALAPAAFGPPLAFASHAFGNPLRLLVESLEAHFRDAVKRETYVWIGAFACAGAGRALRRARAPA